jgi:hypothetical protein
MKQSMTIYRDDLRNLEAQNSHSCHSQSEIKHCSTILQTHFNLFFISLYFQDKRQLKGKLYEKGMGWVGRDGIKIIHG